MALFDKVKTKALDMGEQAQSSFEAKQEEKAEAKQIASEEKEEAKRLKSIFRPTTELGDISIDMENRLFKVKNATGMLKKNSGALKKTGKALAAVYTLGASVAIEAAMKPDDKIFSFDVLENYELIEDDNVVSSGGLGAAMVGGVLLGGVGAIVGGMTGSKKTKKSIENLALQINTNDMSFPCIMITYIKKETKISSNAYKDAISLSKQSIRCLDMILETMGKGDLSNAPAEAPDALAEIKKLKELLDMEAITQEEFDQKKKELLNL